MSIHCENDKCKYYWEDWCQRDLEDKKWITIGTNGMCQDFERGECQYYKDERESILKGGNNEGIPMPNKGENL